MNALCFEEMPLKATFRGSRESRVLDTELGGDIDFLIDRVVKRPAGFFRRVPNGIPVQLPQLRLEATLVVRSKVEEAMQGLVQKALEEDLPPMEHAPVSARTVATFVEAYNGHGLARAALWLNGAIVTPARAEMLLTDAVEDGLIAAFQFIGSVGARQIVMRDDDEVIARNAIRVRIPRVADDVKIRLADELLACLKRDLNFGRKLLVDGGDITVNKQGRLCATVDSPAEQAEISQPDSTYALAA